MPKGRHRNRLTERDLRRRVDFLLTEVRSEHPVRYQTVTYAMRVISNFCAIGQDAGSATIKAKCRWVSLRALELRGEVSPKEWLSNTINEHQEPLEQIWEWLR